MLFWVLLVAVVQALDFDLCASENLGSSESTSIYMSNGQCKDTCSGEGYAVAITQGQSCWCSNYVPLDTASSSNCDTNCPGYPSEQCGGDGYYGYVIISTPSGTKGAESASSTKVEDTETDEVSTEQPTLASPTSTIITRVTSNVLLTVVTKLTTYDRVSLTVEVTKTHEVSSETKTEVSSETTSDTSSSTESSQEPSTTASPSSSEGKTSLHPTTVYSIKTVNGSATQIIKTQYVTASPSAPAATSSVASAEPSATDADSSSGSSFFDSKGKVAGTFTAVGIVVVGLVSALLYCCCCCGGGRRNDDFTDEENQYSSDELSITNEKAAAAAAAVPGAYSGTHSKNSSTDLKRNSSSKSILLLFSPALGGGGGIGRSQSKKKLNPSKLSPTNEAFMFPISEFDTRLDPNSMFMNTNASMKTLADEQDYSRRILHITNPE